jgi:hypothetical protein
VFPDICAGERDDPRFVTNARDQSKSRNPAGQNSLN